MDGNLAGNVFACRWMYHNKTVCWVTQLVVHQDYREHGLATGLLNQLRHYDDDIYGLMSSHPAACLAAARSFGSKRIFVLVNLVLNIDRLHQHNQTEVYRGPCGRDHESVPNTLCQRS